MRYRLLLTVCIGGFALTLAGCLGGSPSPESDEKAAADLAVRTFATAFLEGNASSIFSLVYETVEWSVSMPAEDGTRVTIRELLSSNALDELYHQLRHTAPQGLKVVYTYDFAYYGPIARASGTVLLSTPQGAEAGGLQLELAKVGYNWLVTRVEWSLPDPAGDAPGEYSPVTYLDYRVIDAEYSNSLDRLIMVSSAPHRLHIYDPASHSETFVELPLAPTSLSIAPSGEFAAVGHDGFISYVDLANGIRKSVFSVGNPVRDVVLAENGYVYAIPGPAGDRIHSVELATGNVTVPVDSWVEHGATAVLHPGGEAIYSASTNRGWEVTKYTIAEGIARHLYSSSDYGIQSSEGRIWVTEDGLLLFVGSGEALRTSSSQSQDMLLHGRIQTFIRHMDHSEVTQKIAVIPGLPRTRVDIYGTAFLTLEGSIHLPVFGPRTAPGLGHGRYVFFDSTGTSLIVVMEAGPGARDLDQMGIVTYRLTGGSVGPASLSGTGVGGANTARSKEVLDFLYRLALPW